MVHWQIVIDVDPETGIIDIQTGNTPIVIFLGAVELLNEIAKRHKENTVKPQPSPIMPVRATPNLRKV